MVMLGRSNNGVLHMVLLGRLIILVEFLIKGDNSLLFASLH